MSYAQSCETAHFTNWAVSLPSSWNGQFHRLGVTYASISSWHIIITLTARTCMTWRTSRATCTTRTSALVVFAVNRVPPQLLGTSCLCGLRPLFSLWVIDSDVQNRSLFISVWFQFGLLKKLGFSFEWAWFGSKNAVRFGYYSYLLLM